MLNYPSIWLSQITKDELAQLLGLSEADAGQIIAAADVNGDGSLSIRGNNVNLHMHYGRNWKRTQTKLPSINSLSHERGSELSEQASGGR